MFSDDAMSQRRRDREAGREDMNPPKPMVSDSLKSDSVRTDSLVISRPKKKQPLDSPVVYEANDSIVFEEGGFAHLYGDGKVNYQKIELGAEIITMNMDSSTVYGRPFRKNGHENWPTFCIYIAAPEPGWRLVS